MRSVIEGQLAAQLPPKLVRELLDAHAEARRNYYLGGLRLSAVEGGRFCEAAFRILEHAASGTSTPLNKQLETDKLIDRLRSLSGALHPDSIRLHIPRALRLVYDIRNKRDAAHLADGIDPNKQDATLVIATIDWVLAEFVRLYHNVAADEAHRIVDNLVERTAPIIQDFAGTLKVLNPKLKAGEVLLVLLYHRGAAGATLVELTDWVSPSMRTNIRKTLHRLVHENAHVHTDGARYWITRLGEQEAETKRLLG